MSYTPNSVNEAYRRKYTEEASEFYKTKMLRLGTMDELRGCFHGIDAPNHLMYKIDTLYSQDGHRAYEFLIEYDVYEPSVGIYYGCKGLTLEGYNHEKEIERFNTEWEHIKGMVCTILNNTFPGKNFSRRIKCTDNANDNTYWPFWITLYEEEDIKEVGIRALSIIRNVYKRFLSGESLEHRNLPIVKYNPDITSFTKDAYNRLLQKFHVYKRTRNGKVVDAKPTNKNVLLFETFMHNAESRRIFYKDDSYEFAWMSQELSNSDFIRLITAFFQYMVDNKMLNTKGGTAIANVPWKELSGVFLSSDGMPYNESLRTQKNDALNMPPNEERHWKNLIYELIKIKRQICLKK